MKLTNRVKPISYVKAHAAEIIRELSQGGDPLIITQKGEATVVMQSLEQYERTQQAMAMLKILAMSQRDIEDGKSRPVDEVFRELRAGLDRS